MSLRKMLKVSLLMLLAMALAATTTHARLDLFGQLLTSKNQPKPNQEEVQVHPGSIPYTECINTCDICFCTLKWPPESNMCICGDKSNSKKPTAAVQKVESSSSIVKPKVLPYKECIETCKHECACTLIYPPELSICVCGDFIESITTKAADDEVEELHKELDLLAKPLERPGGGFMPYPECIKKCDECTICTKIYPIEKAWCYCDKHTTSNSNKPGIQNSVATGDDKQVVLWTKGKLDEIPYEDCIKTCKLGLCACTLPWPPELAICVCVLPIKPEAAPFKSLTTKTAGDDKKVVLWTRAKLDSTPFDECMQNCEGYCVCDLPRPPIRPTCICIPKAAGRALPM